MLQVESTNLSCFCCPRSLSLSLYKFVLLSWVGVLTSAILGLLKDISNECEDSNIDLSSESILLPNKVVSPLPPSLPDIRWPLCSSPSPSNLPQRSAILLLLLLLNYYNVDMRRQVARWAAVFRQKGRKKVNTV